MNIILHANGKSSNLESPSSIPTKPSTTTSSSTRRQPFDMSPNSNKHSRTTIQGHKQQPSTPRQEIPSPIKPFSLLPKSPEPQLWCNYNLVKHNDRITQQLVVALCLEPPHEHCLNGIIPEPSDKRSNEKPGQQKFSPGPPTSNEQPNAPLQLVLAIPNKSPNQHTRELQTPLNSAHLELVPQGITVELKGDRTLAATLSLHPLLTLMKAVITCGINLQNGNVDYSKHFLSQSSFQPFPPFDANPYLHFNPMHILCWNSRGAGNTDSIRAFRDLKNSYNPDIFILTKNRLSGDRATSIISSLGYKRYFKVDAMGFSGGNLNYLESFKHCGETYCFVIP